MEHPVPLGILPVAASARAADAGWRSEWQQRRNVLAGLRRRMAGYGVTPPLSSKVAVLLRPRMGG